jgi:predicted AlkP superfamily pyrophosphatase or phosphodiesterase
MKTKLIIFFAILFQVNLFCQKTEKDLKSNKPKLVVGIVIDQMRWDYLYRYESKYSSNGFKRLLAQGYSCENTQIPYVPTYTAPGHTCVYTGSVPAYHGIISNNWFDKTIEKSIYCTDDARYSTVGDTSNAGKMSPVNMLTTTICDELKLATNFRSKSIGVAIKDRGAILPAGHSADAAYWYSGASGNWITSTYYRNELPTWVKDANKQFAKNAKLNDTWKTILELEKYHESTEDNVVWESPYKNEDKPVFEHNVKSLLEKNSDVIKALPYGNKMTFDFAKSAILGESLGKDDFTDFLTVSLSSTDYIGHQFGTNSIEIEDTYLQLDRELALFINYLDANIGKGAYLMFLTADHGAAHNATFLNTKKIPSGNLDNDSFNKKVRDFIIQEFKDSTILYGIANQQIYLNHKAVNEDKEKLSEIKNKVKNFIMNQQGIMNVVDLENLNNTTLQDYLKSLIENGYNPQRSGDLYFVMNPAWMEDFTKGTTHGTSFKYDTHIPLLWYGWNVKPGKDYSLVSMTDIAATIASLLHIQEPNGCIGKPIIGLMK